MLRLKGKAASKSPHSDTGNPPSYAGATSGLGANYVDDVPRTSVWRHPNGWTYFSWVQSNFLIVVDDARPLELPENFRTLFNVGEEIYLRDSGIRDDHHHTRQSSEPFELWAIDHTKQEAYRRGFLQELFDEPWYGQDRGDSETESIKKVERWLRNVPEQPEEFEDPRALPDEQESEVGEPSQGSGKPPKDTSGMVSVSEESTPGVDPSGSKQMMTLIPTPNSLQDAATITDQDSPVHSIKHSTYEGVEGGLEEGPVLGTLTDAERKLVDDLLHGSTDQVSLRHMLLDDGVEEEERPSESYVGLNARKEYWKYVWRHPAHLVPRRPDRNLTRPGSMMEQPLVFHRLNDAREEALAYLQWCILEAWVPSGSPFAAFSLEQSKDLTSGLNGPILSDGATIMFIARILEQKYLKHTLFHFWENDVHVFQTKTGAMADTSIKASVPTWYPVLSSFFFMAPRRYLGYIYRLGSEQLQGEQWKSHVDALVTEWTDLNLLATVLLSAAVSFAAINPLGKVAKTAILMSIICALGSVVTGVSCVISYRHHSPDLYQPVSAANDVAQYRDNIFYKGRWLSPAVLSFVLSLPVSLLLWSTIGFAVATISFPIEATTRVIDSFIGAVSTLGVIIASAIFVAVALGYVWRDHSKSILDEFLAWCKGLVWIISWIVDRIAIIKPFSTYFTTSRSVPQHTYPPSSRMPSPVLHSYLTPAYAQPQFPIDEPGPFVNTQLLESRLPSSPPYLFPQVSANLPTQDFVPYGDLHLHPPDPSSGPTHAMAFNP